MLHVHSPIVADGRSNDHYVTDDRWRRSDPVLPFLHPADSDIQSDSAVLAEIVAGGAGGCIECNEASVDGSKEDPAQTGWLTDG